MMTEQMKKWLQLAGITQKELAKRVRVHPHHLSAVLRGFRGASGPLVASVAKQLSRAIQQRDTSQPDVTPANVLDAIEGDKR
jgi:transcriptional regulator with XRE-family HTH domain